MSRRDLVHAAALALAVGAIAAAPVVADPTGSTLGGGDFASIAWGFWRVARALPALPARHVGDVLFPEGGALAVADLPEAVALAPATLLFGPVAATNLLQAAHPALAAAAAFLLFRGRSRPGPAAAGAVVFGLSPVLLSGLANGNPDVTPVWLLPVATMAGARWNQGPARALLAGGIVGLAAWCNPYVGVMAGLAALVLAPAPRRADLGCLAIALLAAAIVGGANVALVTDSLHGPGAMVSKAPPASLSSGMAWVRGFAWPETATDPSGEMVHAWYLGIGPLLAAAAGVRPGARWAAAGAAGAVLALGPALHWGPEPVELFGRPLVLPGALLGHVPALAALHIPYRFAALASLATGALAALGLDRLRNAWLLAPLFALDLLAFGGGARLITARPVTGLDACPLLADLEPGAVVDFPGTRDERWLLAQTCHGRPVAAGINRPWLPPVGRALSRPPEEALSALSGMGFRYLVLHDVVERGEQPRAEALAAAGAIVARAPGVRVVDLGGR